MKTFLSQTTLVRKSGRSPATIAGKIADGTITPDAIAILGSRQAFLFDAEKLPAIRAALLHVAPEVKL